MTEPRNAAPANVRSNDTATLPPASIAAATKPAIPAIGAIQVDGRREFTPGERLLDLALDAGHLGNPSRPSIVLLGLPRDAGVPVHDRHSKCEQRRTGHGGGADLADPNRAEAHTEHDGRRRPSTDRCHEAAIRSQVRPRAAGS